MNIAVELPEEIAERLEAKWGDPEPRAKPSPLKVTARERSAKTRCNACLASHRDGKRMRSSSELAFIWTTPKRISYGRSRAARSSAGDDRRFRHLTD